MKNKIIALLALTSIITPLFVQARFVVPTANLTIAVNTQAQDGFFVFDLSDGEQFTLETQNLSASQTVSMVAFGSQYSLSQETLDGLKISDINCVSDNPSDSISYGTDVAFFSPTINENITCTFNNVTNIGKTPVLIVPGLIGTDIKNGGDLLWMDPQKLVGSISDNFLDPLQFNDNLDPSNLGLVTDKVIGIKTFNAVLLHPVVLDYTEKLTTELINQGYIENQTLFKFAYDWRYGATGTYPDGKTNADLLAEKIQQILAQTGSDKVDIIAHSMGGLITKQYVASHVADNHIGKAVFVGVPSTGAPYAVKDLLVGDNLGSSFVNPDEIKKISQNMPGIYDLLPSQQYYDTKGSYVKVVDQGFTGLFTTSKDLTYSETSSFLTSDHQLNATATANGNALHTANYDNFDLRTAGVDLYAIDGCKTGTLGNITEVHSKTLFGVPVTSYDRPKLIPGDGTVPLESSTNLPIDQANKYYALTGEHAKLMSMDGTRQQIVNILSGSNLAVDSNIVTQDISKCKLNGKAVSVFSPVDLHITDQDGNEVLVDVWGDHKFVFLPTDSGQTYTIAMQGTATGTYTIKTDDIVNNDVVKTQVFSNLPVTTATTGTVNLGVNGANDSLTVNNQTISPTPPEAIIQFDPVTKDLKFSSLEPSVTVIDQDNIITLKDQAGNVTEITLKEKDRKKKMSAEIKSLKYNGVEADISKLVMKYSWKLDKQGNLKELKQHVKSKGDFNITVKDGQIIKITTNKGDFGWGY